MYIATQFFPLDTAFRSVIHKIVDLSKFHPFSIDDSNEKFYRIGKGKYRLELRFNNMLVQDRIFTAEPQRTRRKDSLFGGRYRQTKRFLFLKTRLMIDTPATERIGLNPEGTEFLLQSRETQDWSRRKISLCDLCASAVKPGVERGEYQSKK